MHPKPEPGHLREFLWPLAVLGCILLLITVFQAVPTPEHPAGNPGQFTNDPPELQLRIPKKGIWKLRAQREAALQTGILLESIDPWVNARLEEDGQVWPVKIRLKGDWTDHLRGGKWSFRVQVADSLAYHRMSAFSLQNPATRQFLDEWLFHKVLIQQGVLAPHYDFVRLRLNGSALGVYAIEEHFTKEMLERQSRREGLLLKFSEEALWELRAKAIREDSIDFSRFKLFASMHPEAFQTAKILNDTDLRPIHASAMVLMTQYKSGSRPAADIFDLDAVAKQYALTDLFDGHHSLIWHNRRFYFDPVLQRLEPVVYDAYAGNDLSYLHGPFSGYACNGETSYGHPLDVLGTIFFRDSNFVARYYGYLWAFSDSSWVERLLNGLGPELEAKARLLRREFLFYRHDATRLQRAAGRIRSTLESFQAYSLRWDSTAALDGGWKYCVENYSPLAVRVGGHLLDAFDTRSGPAWVEFEAAQRPEAKVPGKGEIQLRALPETEPRFW